MNRGYSGGKRNREASRDQKKREKEERLRRNRELRARGIDPDMEAGGGDPSLLTEGPTSLPEVKLEDVVIGVASVSRRGDFGPTKLFVGGLSADMTTDQLRSTFAKFGNIVDAMVIADRATRQSRGFGFVTFQTSAAAETAIKEMNGVEVDGHALKVNRAEARPHRF